MDDDLAWDDMEEDAFNLDAKLSIGDEDDDRFKDEDVEEEKAPGPAAGSAKKPKKKTPIKTSNAGAQEASTADAKPIDREQQRKLQLAADQENAADLFDINEDLGKFIPEDSKEYEQLGMKVAMKYLIKYAGDGADYHLMVKQLLRTALGSMSSADVKDIESCVVALRNEALKKEKEKQGKSKKAKKREQLNAGRSGGSAGLDDADHYEDYDIDDDYDFM